MVWITYYNDYIDKILAFYWYVDFFFFIPNFTA